MKRIYAEYFQVSENGKVRDNVLNVRLTLWIIGILLCLLVMSVVSFAYFSHNVSSQIDPIFTAWFDVTLSASSKSGSPTVNPNGEGGYVVYLQKDVPYVFSLSPKGSVTTGFCRIAVDGSSLDFHTAQLGEVSGVRVDTLSFQIELSEAAYVIVTPCWGTSSYYGRETEPAVAEVYLAEGKTLSVAVDPAAQILGNPVGFFEPPDTESEGSQQNPSVNQEWDGPVQDDEVPSDTGTFEGTSGSGSDEDSITDVTDAEISSETLSDLPADATDSSDSSKTESEEGATESSGGETEDAVTDFTDGEADSESLFQTSSDSFTEDEASDSAE